MIGGEVRQRRMSRRVDAQQYRLRTVRRVGLGHRHPARFGVLNSFSRGTLGAQIEFSLQIDTHSREYRLDETAQIRDCD